MLTLNGLIAGSGVKFVVTPNFQRGNASLVVSIRQIGMLSGGFDATFFPIPTPGLGMDNYLLPGQVVENIWAQVKPICSIKSPPEGKPARISVSLLEGDPWRLVSNERDAVSTSQTNNVELRRDAMNWMLEKYPFRSWSWLFCLVKNNVPAMPPDVLIHFPWTDPSVGFVPGMSGVCGQITQTARVDRDMGVVFGSAVGGYEKLQEIKYNTNVPTEVWRWLPKFSLGAVRYSDQATQVGDITVDYHQLSNGVDRALKFGLY